jgi:CRISPR/Cas system-associated exonuclease Cas4 (RecB family)
VAYGLFHQIADGRYPNIHYMKKRWGDTWNNNRTKEDVLFDTNSWRNDHRKLERKGTTALLALHKDFKNNPGTPILIGKEYKVQIGKHQVTGVIDLVREITGPEDKPIIEILDFKSDDRPTNLHVKGDIEVTAASMAFRKLFNYKENQITYHGILSGQQQTAVRTPKDYQLLEMAVDNVARAIEQEIFYPVLNHKCNECPFQKHCEKKEWF